MKTERQWQRLWEKYCEEYKNELLPQNQNFRVARRLLLEYTMHQSRHSVSELPYYATRFLRMITGSWNRHHALEVTNAIQEHISEPEHTKFLISTKDNDYEHLTLENPGGGAATYLSQTPHKRKWLNVGTSHQNISKAEFEKFDEAVKAGRIKDDILTLADGTEFKLKPESLFIKKNSSNQTVWKAQIQAVVRHEQVYDMLVKLQDNLTDVSINPNGDLAKILRVISKKTGHSIAVAYDKSLRFRHYGSMVKDFLDTFKPYKYKDYDFKRDLSQPINGLENLVKGIFSLVGIPLIVVRNVLSLVFNSRSHNGTWYSLAEDILNNLALIVWEPSSYLVDGLFSLIRGATQIATSPLLLIKVPLRLFLGKDKQNEPVEVKVQNSKSIQEMFIKLAQTTEKAEITGLESELISETQRKFAKGIKRGGFTAIDNHLFTKAKYPENSMEDLTYDDIDEVQDEYLNQFRVRN